jgi:hypothetical protein
MKGTPGDSGAQRRSDEERRRASHLPSEIPEPKRQRKTAAGDLLAGLADYISAGDRTDRFTIYAHPAWRQAIGAIADETHKRQGDIASFAAEHAMPVIRTFAGASDLIVARERIIQYGTVDDAALIDTSWYALGGGKARQIDMRNIDPAALDGCVKTARQLGLDAAPLFAVALAVTLSQIECVAPAARAMFQNVVVDFAGKIATRARQAVSMAAGIVREERTQPDTTWAATLQRIKAGG